MHTRSPWTYCIDCCSGIQVSKDQPIQSVLNNAAHRQQPAILLLCSACQLILDLQFWQEADFEHHLPCNMTTSE
jgi:hypothetical protein